MQDRVPIYPGRVTLTPVEGQENTYDMVRADQPTQIGTALSKANLLTDDVAAQFGLDSSAVPNDILSWLGKYNEYWWSSIVPETYGYIESRTDISGSQQSDFIIWHSGNISTSIQYSKRIKIDQSTGEISLVDPQTLSKPTNSNNAYLEAARSIAALAPCYITGLKKTTTEWTMPFYIPAGATAGTGVSDTICADIDDTNTVCLGYQATSGIRAQAVSSTYAKIAEAGDTVYLHSTDRNAYPDSGTVDGITYTYLGCPFEQFPLAPYIVIGNYTGTGTYGSSRKSTLTFDRRPLFFAISYITQFYAINGAPSSKSQQVGTTAVHNIYLTWNGNSVSWYSDDSAEAQSNISGRVYRYVAILQ